MRIMRGATMMVALTALSGAAAAQNFPPDAAWTPLPCGAVVMNDRFQDQAGAFFERDVIGDNAAPAGYRAFDANFLYLRLRVDQDPAPGGVARPFSWGFEFDLDGDPTTYELLVLTDGVAGMVELFRNTVTTAANSPSDPADVPAVAAYPFATHAHVVGAGGSLFGGDRGFFIDMCGGRVGLGPRRAPAPGNCGGVG